MSSFKLTSSTWVFFSLIRFVLAFIVVLTHIHYFAKLVFPLNIIQLAGGKVAVYVFLLISGISIGHSYLKSKEGYFKKRFLRIYPLYFIAVIFTVFLQYYIKSPYDVEAYGFSAAGAFTSLANVLLLQNFIAITVTWNGALWSISLEVFYYLILPFLVKLKLGYLLILFLISFLFFSFAPEYKSYLYGIPAIIYFWPWLLGFLIVKFKKMWLSIFFIVGAVGLYFNKVMAPEKYSFLTFLLLSFFLLFLCYKSFNVNKTTALILNYLGEISYPLYLFHIPVLILLYYLGFRNIWVLIALLFVIVVVANYVFDYWLKAVFWVPMVKIVENLSFKSKL